MPKRPAQICALESYKSGEDNQRRRQDITNCNAVDKDALRQPSPHKNGLDLHKWYRCVSTAKRERASNEAQNKEVDERGRLGDAKGKGHWRGHAVEDDIDSVADVLEEEENCGGDP